ncbi:hypothetical protein AB834_02455 [PVC group bacterium (ex Bugula neritina AB1)]|nr:hypothetical protein AB834_02455 [PVC group bacterium (ex Bugula neritina AB1)]
MNLDDNLFQKWVADLSSYQDKLGNTPFPFPDHQEICSILDRLSLLIFYGYNKSENSIFSKDFDPQIKSERMLYLFKSLYKIISKETEKAFLYKYNGDRSKSKKSSENITHYFLDHLPNIRKTLNTDIIAAEKGDPATGSFHEIILSYPCVYAIMVHRLAHEFFKAKVPLIPRMMSERAHSLTGIDIHPGATIGDYFFIDHGTGVVIGETCTIGNNVKIYQGVTLGAMSFPKDSEGAIIKGQKRHPSLENNVTIYAAATILGDVQIGENSVIGGNVWLTDSVPKNTVVTISDPDLLIRTKSL